MPYVNRTEGKMIGSLEAEINYSECLRMISDEPVEGNHIFECEQWKNFVKE